MYYNNLFKKKYYYDNDLYEIVEELLTKQKEENYFDFKKTFYLKDNIKNMWTNEEIIKDIFSFHNTTHTKNSFIICGIEDTTNEIVGTNKLNPKELDVINRHLNELANNTFLNHRLNVEVRQIEYEEKNLIFIIIFDSNEVPIYLTNGKNNKELFNKLYVRIGESKVCDLKIPNSTIHELWKKKFKLNLNKLDYFMEILKTDFQEEDFKSIEQDNKNYYLYLKDPLYKINLENSENQYDDFDCHSFSSINKEINYSHLNIYYNNSKIETQLIQEFDGHRYFRCLPEYAFIKNEKRHFIKIYYYLFNDNKIHINNWLNKILNIGNDSRSYENKIKTTVLTLEDWQEIKDYLESNIDEVECKLKNEINVLCEKYKKYGESKDLRLEDSSYYSESISKVINLIIYFFKDDILKWKNIDTIIFKFKETREYLFLFDIYKK